MGKIKRLLDRFDEMGRYPIQELGYSRTWLMFSYLGAFLVHRCTIADYFLYHFYERNRRGRAEFVTLYDMRDIHRKNPQTAFADFEEKDRFLDRFQAYVHRDWIGRVCRNSREEFDAFADRHPRCIIKPRTDSGGHGVELCTITPNNRDQVWERLTSQDMIAEELLEQCPEMAALHPSSVNTVRALTIRGKLCSAVLRMGVGGGFVDNGCSGGIFAGLDVDTGIVTTQGADLMEHRFLLHPTTGLTIPGFQVPQWEQVRRTVEEAVTLVPNAIIVGFNVRPDNNAKESAARNNVDMRMYRVIYDCINEIETAMKGMLAPKFKEVELGQAEVRNVFRITGVGMVAGCYVTNGKMQRGAQMRLLRDNIVIYDGAIASLQRFKDSVKEVAQGYECGITFEKFQDIKEGDVIEAYLMEQIEV